MRVNPLSGHALRLMQWRRVRTTATPGSDVGVVKPRHYHLHQGIRGSAFLDLEAAAATAAIETAHAGFLLSGQLSTLPNPRVEQCLLLLLPFLCVIIVTTTTSHQQQQQQKPTATAAATGSASATTTAITTTTTTTTTTLHYTTLHFTFTSLPLHFHFTSTSPPLHLNFTSTSRPLHFTSLRFTSLH